MWVDGAFLLLVFLAAVDMQAITDVHIILIYNDRCCQTLSYRKLIENQYKYWNNIWILLLKTK